jgi:hypoxanthine phosphoribosyltransferase
VPVSLRRLTWADIGSVCDRLVTRLDGHAPDLVVGIAKGGLPIAVSLCHHLRAPAFGTLHLFQSATDDALDLDVSAPLKYQGAVMPDGHPRRILLVDDVVTKGLVMAEGERLLRQRYDDGIEVTPVTAFSDPAGIASGPVAGLGSRLVTAEEIDNTRVWIVFPWELTG